MFRRFSAFVAASAAHASAFAGALAVIVLWGVSGPLFGFSNTWQLVINTGTTIVTFLLGFLILNAQARDTAAVHLKLDELIRQLPGPRDEVAGVERLSDGERARLAEGAIL